MIKVGNKFRIWVTTRRVKPPEKEKQTFTKALEVEDTPGVMNKDLYRGFTVINCEVKRSIQEQVSE
jgi:hypothetical protein